MEKKCCNPYKKPKHNKHAKANYKKLRFVTQRLADHAKTLNIKLVANTMKICDSCRRQIDEGKKYVEQHGQPQESTEAVEDVEMFDDNIMPIEVEYNIIPPVFVRPKRLSTISTASSASTSSGMYLDKLEWVRKFNEILPLIGVTPIDSNRIKKSNMYCHDMIDQITTNLARRIFDVSLDSAGADAEQLSADQEIVNQLKLKFAEATNKEQKIQILSVLPRSWSARKIVKEFDTTIHLALLSKKLVEESGILCTPKQRAGTNVIDRDTKDLVKQFYVSDEISRVCAGKRDYVTVNENNVKIAKQRRLILMNLAEAYALFKQQNIGRKIGFSTFASLRPAECVLALSNVGTHCVCVCAYHQNVKLVFESMKKLFDVDSYRDLFKRMLCASPSNACHLNLCQNCPGVNEMEKHLCALMENNEMDTVSYKQWINEGGKNKILLFRHIL